MRVALTHWPKLTEPLGRRVRTTWPALLERLRVPREHAVKNEIPGFALATFAGDRRKLANVEEVFAIGLDFDHLDALSIRTNHDGLEAVDAPGWLGLCRAFENVACFAHTTWQSTEWSPRARVFVLLSRPVNAEEYRVLYVHAAGLLEEAGFVVDRQASDPSRLWFLPAKQPGGDFVCFVGGGPPMHVGEVVKARAAAEPVAYRPRAVPSTAAIERARKYLAACPHAISGSGGHAITFSVAQKLVRGFCLSEADALDLLSEWNARCVPPWSDRELRHKIEQATKSGRHAEGDMLARRGR